MGGLITNPTQSDFESAISRSQMESVIKDIYCNNPDADMAREALAVAGGVQFDARTQAYHQKLARDIIDRSWRLKETINSHGRANLVLEHRVDVDDMANQLEAIRHAKDAGHFDSGSNSAPRWSAFFNGDARHVFSIPPDVIEYAMVRYRWLGDEKTGEAVLADSLKNDDGELDMNRGRPYIANESYRHLEEFNRLCADEPMFEACRTNSW